MTTAGDARTAGASSGAARPPDLKAGAARSLPAPPPASRSRAFGRPPQDGAGDGRAAEIGQRALSPTLLVSASVSASGPGPRCARARAQACGRDAAPDAGPPAGTLRAPVGNGPPQAPPASPLCLQPPRGARPMTSEAPAAAAVAPRRGARDRPPKPSRSVWRRSGPSMARWPFRTADQRPSRTRPAIEPSGPADHCRAMRYRRPPPPPCAPQSAPPTRRLGPPTRPATRGQRPPG